LPPDDASSSPPAIAVAVRDAARFDRARVSVLAGLQAAIPVVAVLAIGIVAWDPVAGVTMGAGAMLVGIAWRTAGGRPPIALMATDAGLMALSTFVGSVTGSVPWLHFAVICLWAAMGGLLAGVGNRGGVLGTQAIIALVVFGRFSQPAGPALGLAFLVLAGGFAQVVFLSLVRWPSPLRAQRHATATAYRVLSEIAGGPSDITTLPAALALDEAEGTLAAPALFGDPAIMTLRTLVNEGHRLRVQLAAVHALGGRIGVPSAAATVGTGSAGSAEPAVIATRALDVTAGALTLAAQAIEGDEAAADGLSARVAELGAQADAVSEAVSGARSGTPDATALQLSRRLHALAGQLRAVCGLAPAAGQGGGLRSRRPQGRTNRPLQRLRSDLEQMLANASLDSPVGRHAVRLTVVVAIAELAARELPLQRSYWMVVAAATVLRPEFGATFTRGTERVLGTVVGVALAGAIAAGLHPAGGVTVAIVGLLAWAGYAVFPASFAAGFAFITALVVFLLNAVSPDTLATASARLLDTLVGGSIGLLAYALWPTWARTPARQALGGLISAQRAYALGVLTTIVDGRRAREQEMRTLARQARLARTSAEATVALSLSEPRMRRIDAEQSQGMLGALRRLIQAVHVLRLEAQDERERPPIPELAPFTRDLDHLLARVEAALESPDAAGQEPLPDLRGRYQELERALGRDPAAVALLAELDEIVDAANGLAALAGHDPSSA
jgi:uncharacterized membrane protein YccC